MAAYIKVFIIGLQETMEYRLRLFIDLVIGFLPILIQMVLWAAIYRPLGPGGIINGYTFPKMLVYLVLTLIVFNFIRAGRVETKIATDIKEGTLSKFLLKPIDNMLYHYAASLAGNIFYLVFIFTPVFILIKWILPEKRSLLIILFSLVSLFLGYLLHFIFNYILGTLAFWMTKVTSFFYMKNMILLFLSGGVIPVSFFPVTILTILDFLPFKYMIYLPIQILLNAGIGEAVQGVGMQLLWLGVLFIGARLLWKFGLKQYSAVGN